MFFVLNMSTSMYSCFAIVCFSFEHFYFHICVRCDGLTFHLEDIYFSIVFVSSAIESRKFCLIYTVDSSSATLFPPCYIHPGSRPRLYSKQVVQGRTIRSRTLGP